MVIDSGTKHRRASWLRRRTRCAGCGQAWPCFVAMSRRALRRERAAVEAEPCACSTCRQRGEERLDEQAAVSW